MTPERWNQIKQAFHAVLEDPDRDISEGIAVQCGGDLELKREVDRLIQRHLQADGFLAEPAVAIRPRPDISPVCGDRFEIQRLLGSGGFGDVYAAFDRHTGSAVALKSLRAPGAASILRFKREFRTVSRLHHPNLVRLYELLQDATGWFIAMELLDGCDIGQAIQEVPASGRERVIRDFLTQIAAGLTALHDIGVLHRDIKPSNVWLTTAGRLVLLDFGLAKSLERAGEGRGVTLGTPYYVSPEQAAGEPLSPACDWYSVGVVLYEVLTGKLPIEGGISSVLTDKQSSNDLRPSCIVKEIPAYLDDLCAGLLRRDPSTQHGARDVLAALRCVADAVPRQQEESWPNRAGPTSLRFRQLAELHRSLRDTDAGTGICVHVAGESGVGKTWLVRRFLESIRAQEPNTMIFQGRCYESESVPYEAFDGLLDDVARRLETFDSARLDAVLPDDLTALAKVFPVFSPFRFLQRRRVSGYGGGTALDQRRRAFQAVRELLARLSRRYPVILFIDDLQWGDLDSIPLFREILSGPDSPAILFIVAFRAEDQQTSELLTWLERERSSFGAETRQVECGRLSPEESRELADSLFNQASSHERFRDEIDFIANHAEGNSFLIQQAVHAALDRPSNGAPLQTLDFSLGSRIHTIDAATHAALDVVAVSGGPAPEKVVYEAAGIGEELLAVRSNLVSKSLARVSRTSIGLELDVYHARIRQAVVANLSADRKRMLNLRLAQALESAGMDEPERLARHFLHGDDRGKALEYSLKAADHAAGLLAFDRAARLYRQALELEPSEASAQSIWARLGEALSNSGRGLAAAEAYFRSASFDSADNLRLRILATEQLLRSGHVEAGMRGLRETMREVGMPYPKGRVSILLSILYHRVRIRLRRRKAFRWSLETSKRNATAAGANRRREQLLDVSWSGAIGTSMFDPLRSADLSARHFLWALDSGDPRRLCLALAAEITQSLPDAFRSDEPERLLASARRIADGLQDKALTAFVVSMSAISASLSGQWRRCLCDMEHALELYDESGRGAGWERVTAISFSISSRVLLGQWQEIAAAMPRLVQEAEDRGDRYALVVYGLLTNSYALHLAADRPELARSEARRLLALWTEGSWDLPTHYEWCMETDVELYLGNGRRAWQMAEIGWKRFWGSGLRRLQLLRVFARYIHGKCALAAAASFPRGSIDRSALLRKARKIAGALEAEGVDYARSVGSLLLACAAVTGGDKRRGLALLEEAGKALLAVETIPLWAACQVRRAGLTSSEPERLDASIDGSTWMRERKIVNVPALLDFLAPGDWRREE